MPTGLAGGEAKRQKTTSGGSAFEAIREQVDMKWSRNIEVCRRLHVQEQEEAGGARPLKKRRKKEEREEERECEREKKAEREISDDNTLLPDIARINETAARERKRGKRKGKRLRRRCEDVATTSRNAQGLAISSAELDKRLMFVKEQTGCQVVCIQEVCCENFDADWQFAGYRKKADAAQRPGSKNEEDGYYIAAARGAAVAVFRPKWVQFLRRNEKSQSGGILVQESRTVLVKLPKVSIGSAYGPVDNSKTVENSDGKTIRDDSAHFDSMFLRINDKRQPGAPVFWSCDNIGVVGDSASRRKAGLLDGWNSGKHGGGETSARGAQFASETAQTCNLVNVNVHFKQQSSPILSQLLHETAIVTESAGAHWSRLAKPPRWRELDVFLSRPGGMPLIRACATVDTGSGADHLSKVLTARIETHYQTESRAFRIWNGQKKKDDVNEACQGAELWRATSKAKCEFSLVVERDLKATFDGPEWDKDARNKIEKVIAEHKGTLQSSAKAELEKYMASHDVQHLNKLEEELHRLRKRLTVSRTLGDEELCNRLTEQTELKQRERRELIDKQKFRKSPLNSELVAQDQRQLRRKRTRKPFPFPANEAAPHFKSVSQNELLESVDLGFIDGMVDKLSEDAARQMIGPWTLGEFGRAINNRGNSKQQPQDPLDIDFLTLKALSLEARAAVLVLVNGSWQADGFQSLATDGKAKAFVRLLFKKGEWELLDNCRGIVSTRVISKLIASLCHERLTEMVERTGFIPPTQGGFRAGFQTSEHIFAIRRMCEDLREQWGSADATGKLMGALALDIRKAYPSFAAKIWRKLLAEWGLAGSKLEKVFHILHQDAECTVLTGADGELGKSDPFFLENGFGEGVICSPSQFGAAYEVCLRVYRTLLSRAYSKQLFSLTVPKNPLFRMPIRVGLAEFAEDPERFWRGGVQEIEFADDAIVFGILSSLLVNFAAWLKMGSVTAVRANAKKTELLLLSDPQVTKDVRYLGNWIDLEEDLERRTAKMRWALSEMSKLPASSSKITRRVIVCAIVRSRGTFGAETRAWSSNELKKLQAPENEALRRMAGVRRWMRQAFGITCNRIRMTNMMDSVESFARYLQAAFMGHLIRSNPIKISRRALMGFFTVEDYSEEIVSVLVGARSGLQQASVFDQVMSSIRKIAGNEVDSRILIGIAMSRVEWKELSLQVRLFHIVADYEEDDRNSSQELRKATDDWEKQLGLDKIYERHEGTGGTLPGKFYCVQSPKGKAFLPCSVPFWFVGGEEEPLNQSKWMKPKNVKMSFRELRRNMLKGAQEHGTRESLNPEQSARSFKAEIQGKLDLQRDLKRRIDEVSIESKLIRKILQLTEGQPQTPGTAEQHQDGLQLSAIIEKTIADDGYLEEITPGKFFCQCAKCRGGEEKTGKAFSSTRSAFVHIRKRKQDMATEIAKEILITSPVKSKKKQRASTTFKDSFFKSKTETQSKSKPEGIDVLPKGISYQPRPNGQDGRKPVLVSSIRVEGRAVQKYTCVSSPSKFQEALGTAIGKLEGLRKDPTGSAAAQNRVPRKKN